MKAPSGPSQKPRISLRVGVVQFCPKIGQVQANITRARELCRNLKPRSMELLCFPEMAFTGYVFDSAKAISPHLEQPQTGPTSRFCQELAEQLSCYVAAGYPERLEPQEASVHPENVFVNPLAGEMEIEPDILGRSTSPSPERHERMHVGANSAVLYSPLGECVLAYRKTNLFETDITWAKPGSGFVTVTLPLPAYRPSTSSSPVHSEQTTVNLTLGICMDLNPQPPAGWTSAEGPYELAEHCVKNNTDILILLNSWLDSGIPDDGDRIAEEDGEEVGEREETTGSDWHTLNYWAARLWPLWRKDAQQRVGVASEASGVDGWGDVDGNEQGEEKSAHETIVVACNRTGEENGKIFAGTSAMFKMRTGSGRARLLHKMGRREEGVQIWELIV